jgi:hypothetical protein
MSLLSERVITRPAHASPTDAKRAHHSARLGWVTFWVSQNSHRVKALIAEGFNVEVHEAAEAVRYLVENRPYGRIIRQVPHPAHAE